ncbi:MAG: hypothetical protein OXF73_01000 [Gammaproteobacteria bacterium]|nr:hypothetical protein [Gammaproteobacteria bacterium]
MQHPVERYRVANGRQADDNLHVYINSRLTIPENDKSAIVVVETPDQKTFATRAFATVAGCLSQATALYR